MPASVRCLIRSVFLPFLQLLFSHIARYAPSKKPAKPTKNTEQTCATYFLNITKAELRQNIRTLKRQYSKEQLEEMSLGIVEKLLAHQRVRDSHTILLYSPLLDEVDISPMLDIFLPDKTVLLPKVTGNTSMELRRYTGAEALSAGAFGIMEPVGEVFSDYRSIDLAIVPGMAFDPKGHRLGRGRGYYDRLLAQMPNVYKIGVCFSFQLVEAIPTDATDILMDDVVS